MGTFEQAFYMGSPKFILPMPFTDTNVSKEPALHQCRIFGEEIQQLRMIPILRGYLKLYTSLDVDKLANFMEVDRDTCIARLMCFKVEGDG